MAKSNQYDASNITVLVGLKQFAEDRECILVVFPQKVLII